MRILAILILMTSLNAFAGMWEDMENGETTAKEGIITDVRTEGQEVILEIETTNEFGSTTKITAKHCNSRPEQQTDGEAATNFKARLKEAEAAIKAKTKFQFGTKGIWNGCLSFLRPLAS